MNEISPKIRRAVSLLFRGQNGHWPPDRLAQRAALAVRIAANRDGDIVNVLRWGRDCDLCESAVVVQWPANVLAFERNLDRMHEWAEGPETADIISAEQAAEFNGPYVRDRAAEAMGY